MPLLGYSSLQKIGVFLIIIICVWKVTVSSEVSENEPQNAKDQNNVEFEIKSESELIGEFSEPSYTHENFDKLQHVDENMQQKEKYHDSTASNKLPFGTKSSVETFEIEETGTEPLVEFIDADSELGQEIMRKNKVTFPFLKSTRELLHTFMPSTVSNAMVSLDKMIFDFTSVSEGSTLLLCVICFICTIFSISQLFWGDGMVFGKRNADSILLLGPSGSGKTAIFHKLCHGTYPETVTSMKVNKGFYALSEGKSVKIIDLPGHQRLQVLGKELLPTALGIIFVFDATDVASQIRPAAEMLFDLLTDPVLEMGPSLLIVSNKVDVPNAKTSARIKALLTKELDQLRKTRNSLSSDLHGDDGEARFIPLGRQNQPLNLDQDSPCEINFVDASAKNGSLEKLESFVESYIS
mmetsp:Transcript_24832/g.32441  ORF Transcript_24832/g.32441 Transcript_24832/m.32441 type:complete len:409 (-) Transcript_24832:119-1345(-)|eukprot:CAMPEP_0117754488 /NCGR_PEP_ID=MMETSP0947-20121206/12859_1 /TAXON_ID=44440 /ORGANISM="Chattonella subsalsa, Strain CCMP2191" /LENGTH=408 /DNA_ID=CAMNT_0005573587 /DNA_START=58 /DNA_END=1284 /DNA_ORIENTATION=-